MEVKLQKPSDVCEVCKFILDTPNGPVIAQRIWDSTLFSKGGVETLKALATEWGVPYNSLHRHATVHQGPPPNQLAPQMNKPDYVEGWETIIEKGMGRIRKGEVKVTLPMTLKAMKDKADYEAKQDDQQIDAMRMMFEIASGERQVIEGEVVESTGRNSEAVSAGARRPDGVHHQGAGDAFAPGSDTLPTGD